MKNVRWTLLFVLSAAAILSVVLARPAVAADLGKGLKDAPIAPALPAYTWRGPYIGGHLGGAFRNGSDRFAPGVVIDGDDTKFIGGVHGGYNWQPGMYVVGIEGDVSFGDKINYLSSIRGRLGVASNKWLVYATGGVAFAEFDTRVIGPGFVAKTNKSKTGYAVGGGLEFKLSSAVSLGAEAIYYGFDKDENQALGFKIENNATVVRGRLTWHFGGGGGGGGHARTPSKY